MKSKTFDKSMKTVPTILLLSRFFSSSLLDLLACGFCKLKQILVESFAL